MANDNKSIIKEALTDYDEIMKAADANAKKKLAEEFPDKFNNLLKEEIIKNKKSAKESYKKLDEGKESEKSDKTEISKESVMKSKKEETKKVVETAGEGKPFGEKPKSSNVEKSVVETAGEGKPFGEKPKSTNVEKTVVETAGEGKPFGEKPKKGDVEKVAEASPVEEDVKITDTVGSGDPFKEKAKKVQKVEETAGKKKPLQTETFDITELDMSSVENTLDNATNEDEVITMNEIEEEIKKMEGLGEELKGINSTSPSYMEKGNKGVAFNELVNMRNKLDEMINSMGGVEEQKNNGGEGANKVNPGGPTTAMIDEKNVDEMHGGDFNTNTINKMHQGAYDNKLIDEEGISDEDINSVLGKGTSEGEQPVEEAMGIAFTAGTINPGRLGDHEGTHGRFRHQGKGVDESQKKLGSLINENKNLTKKLNEVKKYKTSVSTLLEQYKTALEKYRNQLKEMAIFNTNLAHVNNLLVNESIALTQDDKIKIINEFKKVDSISDSQKKYKNFLTEMKGSKKTLTESIEAKANVSIQPSSKQKLDVVTAYENDAHIQKMRRLIEAIEKKDKKIIR